MKWMDLELHRQQRHHHVSVVKLQLKATVK